MGRVSISSALLMGGGGVRSILLFPLMARYLETIDAFERSIYIYIYRQVLISCVFHALCSRSI